MASEVILKKLYLAAQKSKTFEGLKPADIWTACQAFINKTDTEVEDAIANLAFKEDQIATINAEKLKTLQSKQITIDKRRKDEQIARKMDTAVSEELLKLLFNK